MKKLDIVKTRRFDYTATDEELFLAIKKCWGLKDVEVNRKMLLDTAMRLSVPTEPKPVPLPPEKKSEKKQEGNLTAVVNEEIGFSEVPIIIDTVIQPIGKPLLPPPGFKVPITPPIVVGKPKTFDDHLSHWLKQGVPEKEARGRATLSMMGK